MSKSTSNYIIALKYRYAASNWFGPLPIIRIHEAGIMVKGRNDYYGAGFIDFEDALFVSDMVVDKWKIIFGDKV